MKDTNIFSDLYGKQYNGTVAGRLIHTNTKAYPSINSTNGGNIHSEENVRWLTKQFTNKPFVISHVANYVDSADPLTNTGGAGDGSYISGGLLNIDGWLVNISPGMDNTSFDKSTNSTIGDIGTQPMQRIMLDFLKGASSNMDEFLFEEYRYSSEGSADNWNDVITRSQTSPVEVGSVTVQYNEKLTSLLMDPSQKYHETYKELYNNGFVSFSDNSSTCSITYPVEFGKLEGLIASGENKLSFTDVFGFVYVHETGRSGGTLTYPSSSKTPDMDMFGDTVTPGQNSNSIGNESVNYRTAPFNIVDATQYYSKGDSNNISTNLGDFYYRDIEKSVANSQVFESDFLQDKGLESVPASKLYEILKVNAGVDTIMENRILSPHYYCISSIPNDLRLLYGNDTDLHRVPVGFMDASGALMMNSVYYKHELDEKDENGNTVYEYIILVEGYGAWLKRMCMELGVAPMTGNPTMLSTVVDDHPEYSPYKHYSDDRLKDNWALHHSYWKEQFIKWNTGDYSGINATDDFNITLYNSIINSNSEKETPPAVVSFSDVYNRWIAPYMNLHMQIAWSSLCENTLPADNNSNNKILSHRSGRLLAEDYSSNGIKTIVNVKCTITKDDSTSYEQDHDFEYPCDLQTDVERVLLSAAASQSNSMAGGRLAYRPSLNNATMNNAEDFINRLKRCKTMETNGLNSSNTILISYRVTSLDWDNSDNDFKNVQKNGDDILIDVIPTTDKQLPAPIPSYIYNVTLDINTLAPVTTSTYPLYDNDKTSVLSKSNASKYDLSLETDVMVNWDGTQLGTISGYKFVFSMNTWVVGVPVVFKAYQDSQNHLKGEDISIGNNVYGGLTIEHELPCNITDDDAWFLNLWYQGTRTIGSFEIETNNCVPPSGMGTIDEYLKHRRESVIHFDKLYGDDFISFYGYISQQLKLTTDSLQIFYDKGTCQVNLDPNEYYDVEETDDFSRMIAVAYTGTLPTDKYVFKSTVRFKFKQSRTIKLNMRPTYNSGSTWLPWKSNYPITYNSSDGCPMIVLNANTPEDSVNEAIMDLTFTPSENICTINLLHNPDILNTTDMSYLLKSLYSMDTLTWEQIHQMCELGLASKLFKLGDTKEFTITVPQDEGDPLVYNVPATIIGFDCDGTNTITFMVNTTEPIWNNRYTAITGTTTETVDGIEIITTKCPDGYHDTTLKSALSATIPNYIEESVKNHLVRKLNHDMLVYAQTENDVISIISYKKQDMTAKLWLPSLSELGLSVDSDELTADTQDCSPEWVSRESYEGNCYPYFELPKDRQHIINTTMITRSTRMLVKEPSGEEFNEDYFNDLSRDLYVVGASYDDNQSDARFLTVIDNETVKNLGYQPAPFCFVFR